MKESFTYAEINAKANQIANALKEIGIGKNDKVALSCPNLPQFPIVYYGILKTGAVVVPLNILLKEREIAYHLMIPMRKHIFVLKELTICRLAKKVLKDSQKPIRAKILFC